MRTECNPELSEVASVEEGRVAAAFNGGVVTSGAEVLLLGAAGGAGQPAGLQDMKTGRPAYVSNVHREVL